MKETVNKESSKQNVDSGVVYDTETGQIKAYVIGNRIYKEESGSIKQYLDSNTSKLKHKFS